MPFAEKRYIIKSYYSDGSFAGILTQDNFIGYPEFTMDINGGFSEIRLKAAFTFLEWWLEPDGLQVASTLSTPQPGYTGPYVSTYASGEFNVFNGTFIGNLCKFFVIENGVETQIWSGIYGGIRVSFSDDRKETFENIFIPNSSRLSSRIFKSGTLTKFTLDLDPADMMKTILTNADIGITYTPDSIEDFGSSFSYTFNAKTAQESLDSVLSLLTRDWYYYIGGDDIFYLGQVDTLATSHLLPLNAVKSYTVEKTMGPLRNRILFLGGNSIFQQFDATPSQELYGIYEERVSDSGITSAADAEALADRILSRQSIIQTAFTIEVIDSNVSEGGYDIESIKPGDQVTVGTEFGDLGFNFWGESQWGQFYWKYDVYTIGGIPATVRRINYRFNSVILECAFNYQNVAELLNKTDREVRDLQFADAPTEPS